jgi:hypothetical protein
MTRPNLRHRHGHGHGRCSSFALGLCLAAVSGGCFDSHRPDGADAGVGGQHVDNNNGSFRIDVSYVDRVDVLFVIDASPSMAQERSTRRWSMAANVSRP